VQNSLCIQVLRSRILAALLHGAWHFSSGPQPNCVAWYKEWNYRTFAEGATYIQLGGRHVWHRPHSSSFFFSSPIVSGHRVDVYHISARDVVLVQI